MTYEPISVSAQHAKEAYLSREKGNLEFDHHGVTDFEKEVFKHGKNPFAERFQQMQEGLQKGKEMIPGQEDNMIRISISHKFRKKDEVAWISVPFSREEVLTSDAVIGEIKVKVITLVEEIKKNFDDAMDMAEPLIIHAPEKKPMSSTPPEGSTGSSNPMCNHGEMVFKSGKSKESGKLWAGYFCTERDRSQQCEPKWSKAS